MTTQVFFFICQLLRIQYLGLLKEEVQSLATFLVRHESPISLSVGGEWEQRTATMAEMLLSDVKVHLNKDFGYILIEHAIF